MALLSGYGSDDSDNESEEGKPQVADTGSPSSSSQGASAKVLQEVPDSSPSSGGGGGGAARAPTILASTGGSKRKVVNYSQLPVSRPLNLEAARAANASPGADEEEPALKRAAVLVGARSAAGQSLLAALPPPKVTLGKEIPQSGSTRIDLSGLKPYREKPAPVAGSPAELLRPDGLPDLIREDEVVPANAQNHPMFSGLLLAGPEGPTAEELEQMRKARKFTTIQANDMKDPDWYMNNQILGGPGLHSGKKVAAEMSMYDSNGWVQTTHANPSRIQKRKHQINWLANEAMAKEAEMLDRNASNKLTKAQTQLKYGW